MSDFQLRIALGGLSMGFVSLLIFIILIRFFCKFSKINQTSLNATLKTGLNQKRKFKVAIYYFHFFGIRIFVAILISISQIVNSYILWSVILGVQVLACLASVIWLYETLFMSILNFLTEVLVLLVFCYALSIHFIHGD